MNGFVNVIKPVGATASDVVVCLKHIFHEKAGHLGTLDPGASGVLPVALGQATRLFNFLTDKVKLYRAYFTFGKTTDTLDSYGVVTATGKLPTFEDVKLASSKLVGVIEQIPPKYSAISVGGVKSYKLVRQGEEIELKPRKVTVYGIDVLRMSAPDTVELDVKCSAGTYIRSLARDLAELCNTVGYMSCLIRLQSGCFKIQDGYTLDEIRELKEQCVLDVMYPLQDVETCYLDEKFYSDLDNGRKVICLFEKGYRKIYCGGKFFGLGTNVNGVLKLQYYLKNL